MTRKWWTMTAVCVGIFMLLLDITVVNVALPSISHSLHASFSDLQWVVDAYALTLAALLLATGSLADRAGRRLVFTVGLVVFTASSLACAAAPDPLFLILARGVQGTGGAAMFATSLALIAQEFQGRDRGTAFGIFGAVTGAAVAVGPLVGGLLTTGISWRAVFAVNVPIGIVAVVVCLTRLVESKDPRAGRVDWAGFATFSGALFLLVYALVRGNSVGWSSPLILGFLSGAAALLVAFLAVERVVSAPGFDLRLFRVPTFSGAAVVAFAISGSIFALFLYITLYLQGPLGYSALGAGLRFLPISLVSFVVAAAAGKASAHVPARLLLSGGLLLIGVGLLLMRGLDAHSGWTSILAGLTVAGAGIGLVNPPLAATAIGVVQPAEAGMASGINSTFRQVGIATGIAGLGALFASRISSSVHATLGAAGGHATAFSHAVAAGAAGQAISAAPAAVRPALQHAAATAFASALNEVFLVGALVAFVGAGLGLVLVRGRDFAPVVHRGGPQPAPSGADQPAEVPVSG